jgi:hypothetical protein
VDTAISTYDAYSGFSLLPANASEWRQNIQFVVGLYLSFATGLFFALFVLRMRHPEHPQLAASRVGLATFARRLRIATSPSSIDKVGKYVSSLGAVASALGALYLGFQRL